MERQNQTQNKALVLYSVASNDFQTSQVSVVDPHRNSLLRYYEAKIVL